MSNSNVVPAVQSVQAGGRSVVIVGADLISSKAIAVIQYLIDFVADGEDLGLNLIVLRDDNLPIQLDRGGKADMMLATMDWATGAVAINLEETLARSYESTLEFDNLSLLPLYWHNLLQSITHECVHLLQMRGVTDIKGWLSKLLEDGKFFDEVEKEANTTAIELMRGFVQTFECEPPAWGEEPYFAKQALGLYTGDPADDEGESALKSTAIIRLDDRIFVYAEVEGEPKPIQDFRGYMALNSDNPEDAVWSQDLIQTVPTDLPVVNTFAANVAETTMPAEEAVVTVAPHPTVLAAIEQEYGSPTPIADEVAASIIAAGATPPAAVIEHLESGPEGVIDDGSMGMAGLMMGSAPGFGGDMQELMDTPIPTIPAANGGVQSVPFTQPTDVPATVAVVPDGPTPSQQSFMPATAPAGGAAASQMQPVQEVYPNHNMTAEEIQQIWYGVASRVYGMMFDGACKFQPGGQPHEMVQGFGYADAVATIPITLTERERMVVVKCECTNAMGQREAKLTSDGELRGWATPKAKLPMYKVWLNCNGVEVCRTLMPQNANTMYSGALTKTAMMARQGHKILYIREGNDAIKKASPDTSLKAKCVDGQWEIINA